MVLAILLQGVGGAGFAVVFRSTRNLLESSVIHIISNAGFGSRSLGNDR